MVGETRPRVGNTRQIVVKFTCLTCITRIPTRISTFFHLFQARCLSDLSPWPPTITLALHTTPTRPIASSIAILLPFHCLNLCTRHGHGFAQQHSPPQPKALPSASIALRKLSFPSPPSVDGLTRVQPVPYVQSRNAGRFGKAVNVLTMKHVVFSSPANPYVT